MDIKNKVPDDIRHLANQLTRDRLGQWPRTPGIKTILTVKFLSTDKELMSVWPEVENPGPFTSEEKRLTIAVLDTVEKATGLSFRVVEEGPAQLTFAQYQGLSKDQNRYIKLSGYADIYSSNPNPYDSRHQDAGTSMNSGDFSGTVPVWIRSSAALGVEDFQKNVTHELGHALGLAHLLKSQQNIDGSIMGALMMNGRALNQPNNGFGDADILALREIYSPDKDRPVDLFHRGSVYYDKPYGHASVSPVGCGQFGDTAAHKNHQIIWLRKGITKDSMRFELLESTGAIKLTFTDNPSASLTIRELSEPLIHDGGKALRFKKIILADKHTLSIDDQLYQTLKDEKQPLWQKGRSLATCTPMPANWESSNFGSDCEFFLTDKQNTSVIKGFRLNADKLVMPELEGRKLHILEQGEKLARYKRNENHVIFRQRELVSSNPRTKADAPEFVLIRFNEKGSSFKTFIDVDKLPATISPDLAEESSYLQRRSLEVIYAGLGNLKMEIQESATKRVTALPRGDIHALPAAMSSFPQNNKAESLLAGQYLPVAASGNRLTPSADAYQLIASIQHA